jgi:transcription elongation factor GreB
MSRGFVREEDQEEIPLVPPRADLPLGVTNYVTKAGMEALVQEREKLHLNINSENYLNENERRIAINYSNAKLQLLNERIASAKVVDTSNQSTDEIRFGAHVSLKVNDEKQVQHYQIVGVDEANIKEGKIAFVAPIAKLLIDKKVGDKAILKLATKIRIFEIQSIAY